MELSIVISIYCDGYLARACCAELAKVCSAYLGTDQIEDKLELIFVNDGSPDDSLQRLLQVKDEFKFVKVVDLSRNFGQHAAIASGLRLARGSYVLRMNVDLQDPPSEIPKLLNEIVTGQYDLVVGQYSVRNSPWINRLTAYIYFETFKFLTGLNVPQHTSPLRVMNRAFIGAYNNLTEKSRFPQGLDQWLGFRHKYIEIEHCDRVVGKSSYTFWSRMQLALTGILYFTDRPLKLIGYFGLLMAALGLLLGLGIVIQKLTGNSLLPGYASLASISLVGFGIQIGSLGLLGLYIGKIFREVQNRPLYIVREIY
jgi:dolichol-phosphate mannosyltransferase